MCTNCKTIYNQSLHYDLYKPLTLQVPCCHCEECRQTMRNEWFARSYYEYAFGSSKMTFFYTLTYNNNFLPTYMGVPHFSRRHVQLFLKRLRKSLSKFEIKLRYIVTCEFGELKGRSHYHALFFIDSEINPYFFYRQVEKSWSYGFVKSGDNVGVVNSSAGIQYVTKYVTKDYSQTNKMQPLVLPILMKRYNQLADYVCKRWYSYSKLRFSYDSLYIIHSSYTGARSVDSDSFQELRQTFLTKLRGIMRDLLPFHLQSTKLGTSMIPYVNSQIEKVPIMHCSGTVKMFALPRYIKRLLWYDVIEGENSHKKDTFVLTEEGVKHKLDRLDTVIASSKLQFENTINNVASISLDILPILNSQCNTDFKHFRDVVYWASHLDLDLEVMAIYREVFRGRVCTIQFDLTSDYVKSYYKDYATACLLDCSNFDFGKISQSTSLITTLTNLTFNLHPYFMVYERALQIILCIRSLVSQFQSNSQIDKDHDSRLLRQLYNSNNV